MEEHSRILQCTLRKWPDPKRLISEKEHKKAICEGRDVPNDAPLYSYPIQVGISGKTFWVNLKTGLTPFRGELSLALPGERRGIHMSRIEEAITKAHTAAFDDVVSYGRHLLEEVVKGQETLGARLFLEGEVPVLRMGPVSSKTCVEAQWVSAELWFSSDGRPDRIRLGVSLNHITACPCTQEYTRVISGGNGLGLPFPTHSQRTVTRLFLDMMGDQVLSNINNDGVCHELLLQCLENSLHVTQGLLKRPDEAELVLQAHTRPQFVEDVVREVLEEAKKVLSEKFPQGTRVEVESLSLESIHTHNVGARGELSL